MAAPTDYISAINEVKQWLSYKGLDEFIYLLVDHGYDDLSALAQCTDGEVDDLVRLFTTPDSKSAIADMVHALKQIGIDVYRKQKGEFRRLIELNDRAKKQNDISEQVSRVRGESLAIKPPPPSIDAAASPVSASTAAASSSSASAAAAPSVATPAAAAAAAPGVLLTPKGAVLKLPPPISATVAAAAAASSDSASNPTVGLDVETWDGAVRFQAYVNSVAIYTRLLDESGPQASPAAAPSMVELEHKLLAGRSRGQLDKLAGFMRALCDGAVFKKYKRGSASKRLIWTSAALDFVIWGEEDGSGGSGSGSGSGGHRRTVKGFIATADIQEINQGFALKNKNRLYIVSPERTLELEAKDGLQAREWKEMLEALIQLNMAELDAKQTISSAPIFAQRFARAKAEHTKLLSTGSVFKKSPGPGKLGVAGSFTTRLVWTPPVPDRLQWGDLVTRKVLGFVLMQDVVHVQEESSSPSKLSIFAVKRSLDLEARNEATRDRWIKALRFFVEFKQKALQQ